MAAQSIELEPGTASAGAISIRDLVVDRGGREILHGVTLEVAAGSVTGLLGPSGCGKSTLMRAIVGVQILAGGTVGVLGAEAGSKALRSRVGYVTQAPSVYGDLSVEENLHYFGAIVGASPEKVTQTTAAVGLDGTEGRMVGSPSGGQRSRVSLASALLGDPEVLILDEPTVGLDPVLRAELWRTFHGLAAAGTTLLVSSHVMDEAGECDGLLLMRDGSLLAQLTPDQLRAETGESDLGKAFLVKIERAESRRHRAQRGALKSQSHTPSAARAKAAPQQQTSHQPPWVQAKAPIAEPTAPPPKQAVT